METELNGSKVKINHPGIESPLKTISQILTHYWRFARIDLLNFGLGLFDVRRGGRVTDKGGRRIQ